MEFSSWPAEGLPSNRNKAFQELTKGRPLTDKLREMHCRSEKIESDLKSVNDVVVQISGMFDNALSILSPHLNGIPHNPINHVRTPRISDDQKVEDFDESIKTMTPVKTKRGCYRRRKNGLARTKVASTLIDDGYAWRKYGQKVILNSKHQRNYFRCSHKFEQGCQATKQVQKISDEPPKYTITYNGVHTCNNIHRVHIIEEALNPRDNSILISFETNTPMKNNKVSTSFQSMKHTPKEYIPSLGYLKHEQVSSSDYTPLDPIVELSQYPSAPMSMMLSGLDHEDMTLSGVFSSTCSTHAYDEMSKIHDLDDFVFELCS